MDINMGMCDDCGINPANVQLTKIENGAMSNVHVCEDCAAKRGIQISFNDDSSDEMGLGDEFDSENFTENFSADISENNTLSRQSPDNLSLSRMTEEATTPRCPQCDTSYASFRETGLLGCPECYKVFSDELTKLFVQIAGSDQYSGKNAVLPPPLRPVDPEYLKKELAKAVKSENFELAAVIRDRLRKSGSGR